MAKTKSNRKTSKGGQRPINPRTPWKRSWYMLWGSISLVGELILIILAKSEVIHLSTIQVIVWVIGIPILAHLIVSAFRTVLIASS